MAILEKADVCRLAMSSNDVPYMVAMNFGIKNGEHPSTSIALEMARRSTF